jgi:hypothetical protein
MSRETGGVSTDLPPSPIHTLDFDGLAIFNRTRDEGDIGVPSIMEFWLFFCRGLERDFADGADCSFAHFM